jgi:predicted RNA-binding Zn-ribbon protein involved in translation (DUF1610 family)
MSSVIEIDVTVVCDSCGKAVQFEVVRGTEIAVGYCPKCIESMIEQAKQEAYEEGLQEGRNE